MDTKDNGHKSQVEQVDVGNPNCPACHKELSTFQGKIITLSNGFICNLMWCPHLECKTLLSMNVIGQATPQQPAIIPAQSVPRLVRKQ
jgi:hypothetical protein